MAERKSNNKNNKKKRFNGNSDEEFNPKFRKTRKKVCTMCANKELVLDYKNYDQMKKFVNEKGKILPRRATGACAAQCPKNISLSNIARMNREYLKMKLKD